MKLPGDPPITIAVEIKPKAHNRPAMVAMSIEDLALLTCRSITSSAIKTSLSRGFGLDYFRHRDPKAFIDDDDLAPGDQAIVHVDIDGLADFAV